LPSLLLHRMALNEGGDGVGDEDVAQIITVDFPARKVMDWGLGDRGEAATEAPPQPDEIADSLRRCVAFLNRAAEGRP
jgi:hypothetical protein